MFFRTLSDRIAAGRKTSKRRTPRRRRRPLFSERLEERTLLAVSISCSGAAPPFTVDIQDDANNPVNNTVEIQFNALAPNDLGVSVNGGSFSTVPCAGPVNANFTNTDPINVNLGPSEDQFIVGLTVFAYDVRVEPDNDNPLETDVILTDTGGGGSILLNVTGTKAILFDGFDGDDNLTVSPGPVGTARVQNSETDSHGQMISDTLPLIEFDNLDTFRMEHFGVTSTRVDTFVLEDLFDATAFEYVGSNDALVIEGGATTNEWTIARTGGNLLITAATGLGVGELTVLAGLPDEIRFDTQGGNDTLTVDNTSGLVTVPLQFNAGTGNDLLTLAGTTGVTSSEYTPGATSDAGTIVHANGATTQTVHFTGLEPILDIVAAESLTVNGTNADNAINYTDGGEFDPTPGAPGSGDELDTGLVSVDGFETIRFSNKGSLVLDGLAGSNTVNLNHPGTPTDLIDITVNGGDPTGSDTLIVNGIAGVLDNFRYDPTAVGAGTVINDSAPQPNVLFTGIEHLTEVVQQADGDGIRVEGTTGNDALEFFQGLTSDSGLFVGTMDQNNATGVGPFVMTPMNFTGASPSANDADINFFNPGGTDSFVFNGTANDDNIAVATAEAGGTEFRNTLNGIVVARLEVFNLASGLVRGLAGNDIITVTVPAGPAAVTLRVEGGDSDPSTDTLNYTAPAGAATTIDDGTSTITSTGPAGNPVTFSGIEVINETSSGAGSTLTINGTAGADAIEYTPTGTTAGTVKVEGHATINFTGVGSTFTLDPAGGNDVVTVIGTSDGETITVDGSVSPATVQVGGLKLVRLVNADTEALRVFGLEGNDTFNVTPSATIPIFIDGGDPIGTIPGDTISVTGAVGFFPGPEADEGGFLTAGETVSFDHIELIGPITPVAGCPFLILGTNGDDDITAIARDDSYPGVPAGPGAGVQDLTFSVNAGPDVLLLDQPDLFIDGLSGDDDIVLRTRAPNLADWDVHVRIVGGPPSAATGDQGDVVEVETPGAVVDDVLYTPTGSDTGTLLLDENNNDVYDAGGTDSLIEVLATFTIACPALAYTSSTGGAEALVYDGEAGDDALTVVGTAGSDTIVHTPGAVPAEGAFRVNSLLGIQYQNLGAASVLTVDGAGGASDRLVAFGTSGNDVFEVAATSGAVTLRDPASALVHRPLNTLNVEAVTLEGLDGDDSFVVNTPQPYTQIGIAGGSPGGSDRLSVLGAVGVAQAFTVSPGIIRGEGRVDVDALGIPYRGIEHLLLGDLLGNGAGATDSLVINDDFADNTWEVGGGLVGDLVQIDDRESIDISGFNTVQLVNQSGTDHFRVAPTRMTFSFLTSFTVTGDAALPVDDVLELVGTPGNDVVTSTATAVTVNGVAITAGTGLAEVQVNTLAGEDRVVLGLGLPGVRKTVDAGDGNDFVNLTTTTDATILGGSGDDYLIGTPFVDFMDGGPGADTLLGLAADDVMHGGSGDDVLVGGVNNDRMYGDDGSDTFVWNPGDNNDVVEGDEGDDVLQFVGGNVADTFTLSANGHRFRLDRAPGGVVIDAGDVEQIDTNRTVTFGTSEKANTTLSGANEVPANASAATGTVLMVYDSATNTFSLDLQFQGLPLASITGAHIHGPAPAGANAAVIFPLSVASFYQDGGNVRLRLSGATFPAANIADLLAGNTYVNIHSGAFPGGEIRAQLNFISGNATTGLTGADTFTVNDLTQTDVQVVNLGLGVNDAGAADAVTVNGRTVADDILITQAAGIVNVAGLEYDVNISSAVAADTDRLTVNGNDGDDTIKAAAGVESTILITLNGNAGDDYLSADAILNGGPGDDFLEGGPGDDTLNGDAGEDTMIGRGGNDTYDGGADFDTILIEGTTGNDRIDVTQTAATTLVYTVNGATETDTLVTVAGVRTVERARIEAGAGDDIIRVSWADSLGQSAVVDSLRMDVNGGADSTRDRLAVVDAGTGDLILYRKGESDSEGSMTVGPDEEEPLEAVFVGIEYAETVEGTGGDTEVFKHDPFEFNNKQTLATHLGAGDVINVDPTIDPGPDAPFNLPGDQDWYRFEAEATGTLDLQVFFRHLATVPSGREGLPGDGNLSIELYDADGTLIVDGVAGGTAPEYGLNDLSDNERIRIPAVEGQLYFLRVLGVGTAINNYTLTAINTAAPVPFDLELSDQIFADGVLAGATATTFSSGPFGAVVPQDPTPVDPPDDFFNGKYVSFLSGPLNGQRGLVDDYVAATRTFSFLAGTFTGAPGAGDLFQVESVDTGRSQLDNYTRDTTPTIFVRVADAALLNDVPDNGAAPGSPVDEVIVVPFVPDTAVDVPNAPVAGPRSGFRVAIFVTEENTHNPTLAGYAQPIDAVNLPGVYAFTFSDALTPDGSYFISARVEMIDPAVVQQAQGFGAFAQSLEIVVDTTPPPAFFGDPAVAGDGLVPDPGVIPQPPFFDDNKTNDTTPTFWGTAEADAVIRVYADNEVAAGLGNGALGVLDAFDVLIGLTVALPEDGTNQFPHGQWRVSSTIDLNDDDFFSPVDGLRTLFVTAEDVPGNVNAGALLAADTFQIFVDTQGPQVTGVFATDLLGLLPGNTLLAFNAASPFAIEATLPITGLAAGDTVVGIDERPANGLVYAVADGPDPDSLYTINPLTGAATFVANLSVALVGTAFGVDFNPVVDALRIVSDADINYSVNPVTGVVTVQAALNPGDPDIAGVAYTNNNAGALFTSLYTIDLDADVLNLQAPPASGTQTPVGPLGINVSSLLGFDIAPVNNIAFAAMTNAVNGRTGLYTIDLTTGEASLIGDIRDGATALLGLTAVSEYDIFDPKPSTDGPSPLLTRLFIRVQDQPGREDPFNNPALNPLVAEAVGNYTLIGDANGIIPIQSVQFIPDPVVPGQPATGTVVVAFFEPLPDDRFTLILNDSLVDDVGNALDGESNADEPQEEPLFPSGDGQPGGDFVARFTVDSRPEVGVYHSGSVWVDTNGNFTFDPDNLDFTNRDITYMLGFTTDNLFAGNFSPPVPGAIADGFDKLAAYGRVGSTFRWLIDTDNDGVPNPPTGIVDPAGINGFPVAGNFDGNPLNGDEVGLLANNTWWFDTNHDFLLDTSATLSLSGLPLVGDFDGDGFDDLGTWKEDTFTFLLTAGFDKSWLPAGPAPVAASIAFGFIGTREKPVAADLDQDGIDDIGLWVPDRAGVAPEEQGEWYFLVSNDFDRAGDGLDLPDRSPGTLATLDHPFEPVPFGSDLFASFGDEFAVPVLGNFDPPVSPTSSAPVPLGKTNLDNQFDINGDGVVTALDVLVLINEVNEGGTRTLVVADLSGPYLDSNVDGSLTALDVLIVINYINNPPAEGEGEGGDAETERGGDAESGEVGAESRERRAESQTEVMAVPSLSSVEWVGLTPATVREVSAPVSPQLDAASVDRYFAGREQRAESREPSLAWGAASGAETVADWVWEDHELWQLASDVDEVSQVAGIDELFAR